MLTATVVPAPDNTVVTAVRRLAELQPKGTVGYREDQVAIA
jgi:hypothetical protein